MTHLPGLTTRRIADLYPGEAKTDARDAFITADAARAMPHTRRALELEDEIVAELEVIAGLDDDLAGEATRVSTRLRGLLTQIHPSLERVLGPLIQRPAVLLMLDQFGDPAQLLPRQPHPHQFQGRTLSAAGSAARSAGRGERRRS